MAYPTGFGRKEKRYGSTPRGTYGGLPYGAGSQYTAPRPIVQPHGRMQPAPAPTGADGYVDNWNVQMPQKQPARPREPVMLPQPGTRETPQANAGAGSDQGVQPGAQPAFDPYSDPAVQKIQALSSMNVTDAESHATKLRKEIALRLGSGKFARDTLGDDNIAGLAERNPTSILAGIRRGHGERVRDTDESLNDANLFYSGHRAKTQADLARALLEEEEGAYDWGRSQEASIAAALIAARNAERSRVGDAVAAALAQQAGRAASGEAGGVVAPEVAPPVVPPAAAPPGAPPAEGGLVAAPFAVAQGPLDPVAEAIRAGREGEAEYGNYSDPSAIARALRHLGQLGRLEDINY